MGPTPASLTLIVKSLRAIVTAEAAPFDVCLGDFDAVKTTGLAYRLAPRQRNDAPAPWFNLTTWARREALYAQRSGQPAPDYRDRRVFLVVHWPQLLWQARLGGAGDTHRLAHELLHLLVDLVDQYDLVLGDIIRTLAVRRSAQSPAFRTANPLDVGFSGASEAERFKTHLNALLRNQSFRRHLHATMEGSLRWAHIPEERLRFIACPGGNRHRKGQSCEKCQLTKWTRGPVSLLAIDRLRFDGPSPFEFKLRSPGYYVPAKDSWHGEVRRILESLDARDGVVPVEHERKYGDHVLVNFPRLVELAVAADRPSPLRDVYYDICDKNLWMSGVEALRLFEKKYGTDIRAPRPDGGLEPLVRAAGWEWNPNTLDVPYEIYKLRPLLTRLDNVTKTVQYLMDQRPAATAKPKERGERKLKRVVLDYRDAAGNLHAIQCFQRKLKRRPEDMRTGRRVRTYYTVPYPVAPELQDPKKRGRHGIVYEGVIYWSLHAINAHVNYRDPDGRVVHEGAAHFAEWLAPIDSEADHAWFRKKRYEQEYADRVARKLRGESKTIGRFLPHEDEALLDFLHNRENKTANLTVQQWFQLMSLLPNRSKRVIIERINQLGKSYCAEHGWLQYANSGLCLVRTAKRRREWMSLKASAARRKR